MHVHSGFNGRHISKVLEEYLRKWKFHIVIFSIIYYKSEWVFAVHGISMLWLICWHFWLYVCMVSNNHVGKWLLTKAVFPCLCVHGRSPTFRLLLKLSSLPRRSRAKKLKRWPKNWRRYIYSPLSPSLSLSFWHIFSFWICLRPHSYFCISI